MGGARGTGDGDEGAGLHLPRFGAERGVFGERNQDRAELPSTGRWRAWRLCEARAFAGLNWGMGSARASSCVACDAESAAVTGSSDICTGAAIVGRITAGRMTAGAKAAAEPSRQKKTAPFIFLRGGERG